MSEQRGDLRVTEFIRGLARLSVGERAQLKRNAGQRLAESRGVLGLFFRLLPYDVPVFQREAYFLVATLFPLADAHVGGDFGSALRRAQSEANRGGLDHRVEVLLDADRDQLPYLLRRAVRFVQSNRVPIDWARLLADILRWDDPRRYVQIRWAESYFGSLSGEAHDESTHERTN